MDGAAKKVNLIAQRILPDRPHHLSLSPTRRYPVPPGFWQHQSRLQYSTFLSDADRGILLTRPYYDIREEPENTVANSSTPNSRPEVKKAVNKMSFKDYQKQKKTSLSPSEVGSFGKADMKQDQSADIRTGKLSAKREENSQNSSDARRDIKLQDLRRRLDEEKNRERFPKVETRKPQSPASDSKKRFSEAEDGSRPQKRPRSDLTPPIKADTSRSPKPETPNSKHLDKPLPRESKSGGNITSATNGRSALATALKENYRASSPKVLANGVKSHNSGSNTSTPRKADSQPSKQSVPPLLSPLHISLDDEHETQGTRKQPSSTSGSGRSQPKSQKLEGNSIKKSKSPLRIPPLLSPTLPPEVEEALARRQVTPKGDSSQRTSQASDTPSKPKKGPSQSDGEAKSSPPSLIVKLKYKKRHAKTVQRILALEPKSKKEARRHERSASVEDTPPPAKKRPRPPEASEPTATKRVKTASETAPPSKPLAPSTPSKSAIAMSRAASGASQALTPGDATGLTPGIPERPPTSHEAVDQPTGPRVVTLRQRHLDFTQLGTKLKHSRDDIIRGRKGAPKNTSNGAVQLSPAEEKRVVALNFEMILAYMIAFKAHSHARNLERKASDYVMWEQLQPHLQELKHRTRLFRPLHSLTYQLNAICLEELVLCYISHENTPGSNKIATGLAQASKRRHEAWISAHDMLTNVPDGSMKAEMGPWTAVGDAASSALRILRRWVDKESVDWKPEIVLPMTNGA